MTGDVSRSAILLLAAEECAGRTAGNALDCFQRAVEDGGEVSIDPRAGIADTLFELNSRMRRGR